MSRDRNGGDILAELDRLVDALDFAGRDDARLHREQLGQVHPPG